MTRPCRPAAAKWYHRWFGEGRVHQVPTAEDIAVEREIPGVRIGMVPSEGQRLSSVSGQDSYSYEVAHIFTGGDDEATCAAGTTSSPS